ncbi:hypothetical protein K439DRAFT_1282658, partial [Ramaria rubella]
RSMTCITVFMNSVNQFCNLLPSIVGIFCHASGEPEGVINMLAHAGISISTTSINNIVNSLSIESWAQVWDSGQSLLTAWCFDNFSWLHKPANLTLETQAVHVEVTSALFQPLEHGVTLEDLHCSEALWAKNPVNPSCSLPFEPSYHHLILIITQMQRNSPATSSSNGHELSMCLQIFTWHIWNILITHGEYFEQFKDKLGGPPSIMQILVKKTTHIMAQAIAINEGTQDGAGVVVDNLLIQASLDHKDEPRFGNNSQDMSEAVILNHLDLGSIEKLHGIQLSQVIEDNSTRQIQYPITMNEILHTKMAIEESL